MTGRLAALLLRILRWKIEGAVPPHAKMLVIGGPHTSNWDFVVGLTAAGALRLRIRWIGKHTIFRPPFGWLMRRLGGIPVDRSQSTGMVDDAVGVIADHDHIVLAMAPEGTRRHTDHWKSGFYRIAQRAGIPLVLAGIDGPARTIRIGPTIEVTGDVGADMDQIRAFYQPFRGIKPGRESTVRLVGEDD